MDSTIAAIDMKNGTNHTTKPGSESDEVLRNLFFLFAVQPVASSKQQAASSKQRAASRPKSAIPDPDDGKGPGWLVSVSTQRIKDK